MSDNYKPSLSGRWEKHVSWRGYPYWVWRKPMPRLDDSFINSVVYLYPSEEDAKQGGKAGGSGFLFGMPMESNPVWKMIYVVTNLHVVANMPKAAIRINTQNGKTDILNTKRDQWINHPDGDDIVMLPIKVDKQFHKYSVINHENLITKEFIEKWNVGGGDDVYLVGRFINRDGKEKNLPSVRKGIIASIDTEPIRNGELQIDQESFLVESHSVSGYSGSPVIVIIEPLHLRPNKSTELTDNLEWHARLLGVDWGHLVMKESVRDGSTSKPISENYYVNSNSAMMCVVPAWKIQDILDLEDQVEMRKKQDELIKKMIAESPTVADNAKEEEKVDDELTKEEFDAVLKKISRPLKKDDQGKKGT